MKCRSFAALCAILACVSCSKKTARQARAPLDVAPLEKNTHTWYCFADGAIKEIDAPQHAPLQPEKPWTEAVRISSASSALGDGAAAPNAYALVNRVGVLVFSGSSFRLYADAEIFANRTAGNLVFQNDTPVFSLYKSTFFNTTLDDAQNMHHFLVQFDVAQRLAYPLITCADIGLASNSEVTDYVWDGNTFICSVKTVGEEKNEFTYLSVQPKVPLLTLSNANSRNNLLISRVDTDAFRSLVAPAPFETAPARLKEVLAPLEEHATFFITCRTAGGHSPRSYSNQHDSDAAHPFSGVALIADTYVCALFNDGTTYIKGALYGKHIMSNNAVRAFRLPRLPADYEYSSFAISGTTLYAAWEETAFYKIRRSGFLSVDLDAVLYNSIAGGAF
ncbi:MAG: hypothetical protein J6I73_00595 [Treponema sp.]|nr:hypothetical protein [Treponema sp.]